MSTRPELSLNVGQELFVSKRQSQTRDVYPVRVVKMARIYATVEALNGRYLRDTEYEISTGNVRREGTARKYSPTSRLITQEQIDYDERQNEARSRIRAAGFDIINTRPPTDGQIIAVARALKMLEDIERMDAEGND